MSCKSVCLLCWHLKFLKNRDIISYFSLVDDFILEKVWNKMCWKMMKFLLGICPKLALIWPQFSVVLAVSRGEVRCLVEFQTVLHAVWVCSWRVVSPIRRVQWSPARRWPAKTWPKFASLPPCPSFTSRRLLLFDEYEEQKLSLPNQPPNFGAALPRRTITPSLTSKKHSGWKLCKKSSFTSILLRAKFVAYIILNFDPFYYKFWSIYP